MKILKLIDIFNKLNGTVINMRPKNKEEGLTSQESYFYWIRNEFNKFTQEQKNSPKGTAYFIFLNKTCFRGVYREGPNGFNVPFGHYKNPEIINDEHVKIISNLIKNESHQVSFLYQPFQ